MVWPGLVWRCMILWDYGLLVCARTRWSSPDLTSCHFCNHAFESFRMTSGKLSKHSDHPMSSNLPMSTLFKSAIFSNWCGRILCSKCFFKISTSNRARPCTGLCAASNANILLTRSRTSSSRHLYSTNSARLVLGGNFTRNRLSTLSSFPRDLVSYGDRLFGESINRLC